MTCQDLKIRLIKKEKMDKTFYKQPHKIKQLKKNLQPKESSTSGVSGFDKKWQQTVARGSLTFGVELSSKQLDLLRCHAEELIRWNQKFNITSIVDPFEVALKHFIDSIAITPFILENSKVIDLGSGGGFPGVPLKVVNPSLEIVMADASRKKVSFINDLIRRVGLTGANAIHCRAEQLGKEPDYSHQFDFVVSRAFTALDKFTDMALPLLKERGAILAMKGVLKPDELAPLASREDVVVKVSDYLLPFGEHKRSIVTIKRVNSGYHTD